MLPSFIYIHVANLVQVSKQLFGIVTGVRCLEQEQAIVTTHAGDISNLLGP